MLRPDRYRREDDEGIQPRYVWVFELVRPVDDVISDPDGVEAEGFGTDRSIDDAGGLRMTSKVGEEDSELHEAPQLRVLRGQGAAWGPLANERGRVRQLDIGESAAGMDMHVIELDPAGPDGPFHYHSRAENFYVILEGSIVLRLRGDAVTLSEGDAVWIPPELPHGVSVRSGERARLLEIYWPAPADYVSVEE
jgi:mannose-6-phosphate isomerase-like protein (cupin superfamily)